MTDITILLQDWADLNAAEREIKIEKHAVEQRIRDAMAENNAEYAEGAGLEVTYKETVEYDKALDGPLAVIAEQLSPEQLDAALTAQKPAPARSFNITKVKALAKQGGIFRDALEKATREQPARLRVRSVE